MFIILFMFGFSDAEVFVTWRGIYICIEERGLLKPNTGLLFGYGLVSLPKHTSIFIYVIYNKMEKIVDKDRNKRKKQKIVTNICDEVYRQNDKSSGHHCHLV